jgi:hypothetical protein
MALTPILFSKNWKDTYGSQFAAEALAAKLVAVTASLVDAIPPAISLNVAHTAGVVIEWGDGELTPSAGGIVAHTFTRNGAYRIRTTAVGYPDLFADVLLRVTEN